MSSTVEMAEIEPDAMVVMTRVTPMVPLAGQPATLGNVRETLHMTRYGMTVTVTIIGAAPFTGDIIVHPHESTEAAEVDFVNIREQYRRDGWTVREPDPWEVPAPVAEVAPF